MAKPQYNTENLIAMIKRACAVPTSQLTYTDADWTLMATTMLQTMVVPLIMSTREDYFVTYEDVFSPVDGYIEFPADAVGSKMRNVAYVSQESPLVMINLPRIDLDVVAGVGFFNVATLAGFYVEGEYIVLYPSTSVPTNTKIRLYYYRRALDLAAPTAYGQVQSIDPVTNTVILDFVPYDWGTGTVLNAVSSTPNFTLTASPTIVTVSSPSIILDSVDGLSVGDYISEDGYSAVPQIPIEAMNYLAQLTAVIALEGLGDREGMEAASKVADVFKQNLLTMISQRVDGSVKKVINPSGGLRMGASTRRGWGW